MTPILKTLHYYIEHSSRSLQDFESVFGKSTSYFYDFLEGKPLD